MATPLMWKASQLSEIVFDKILYRYLSSLDIDSEKFVIERNWRKLIPFYLSFAAFGLTLSFCIYLILGFISNPKSLSLQALVLVLVTTLHIVLCIGLNAISAGYITELSDTLFHLYRFEKRLLSSDEAKRREKDKQLDHFSLFKRELAKLLRGDKSADLMGLLMNALVVSLIFTGVTATIGTLAGVDPGYQIFKNKAMSSNMSKVVLLLRILLNQWCTLEASRTYARILVQAMVIFNSYMECLRRISKEGSDVKALCHYTQLQCIFQIGQQPVRYIAAILMFLGYFLGVLLNASIIIGIHIFAPEVTLLLCIFNCLVYMVIYESVPMATECHEYSNRLLRYSWGGKSFGQFCYTVTDKLVTRKDFTIWEKNLKAQKPVSVCYGVAVFDRETKSNFYTNIFLSTIDILFIIK